MSEAPIGVVVLTHNRVTELSRTLTHLRALPENPPIVVVDNGSSDGTRGFLEACPGVRAIHLARNAGAAARNAGVRAMRCRYIALCDDDTWWLPGSLECAVKLLDRSPGHAVLVARVVVGEECRPDPTSQVMARSPLRALPSDPGTPVLGFLAGASVIRREAFLAAGGFDERYFIGGEEELLAIDLAARGWRMSYVPSLVVRHLPSPNRDDTSRRRYLVRNALWTAWLRRSRATALRRTARALRDGLHDRCAVAGLVAAVRGLPWVLRERRAVAPALEERLRTIERARQEQDADGHATHLQRHAPHS